MPRRFGIGAARATLVAVVEYKIDFVLLQHFKLVDRRVLQNQGWLKNGTQVGPHPFLKHTLNLLKLSDAIVFNLMQNTIRFCHGLFDFRTDY